MARSIRSFGIWSALAADIALRRRALPLGSPPPMRAAIAISRVWRVNTLPRAASTAPFLRLIVAHLECPLIAVRVLGCGPFGPGAGIAPCELQVKRRAQRAAT